VAVVPLVVFGPSLVLEFGLRDDYSMLREVREEPGKVLGYYAAQGRVFYGLLIENSLPHLDGVRQLAVGRLLGALFVGLTGAIVARTLIVRFRWNEADALVCGALLTLLPTPQVITSWAVCWPHAVAGALGVSAFALAERGMTGVRPRWLFLFAALVVMTAGMLTYQTNALLYGVPLAAGWLRAERPRNAMWLVTHLGVVATALAAGFAIALLMFSVVGFAPSDRVAIDWDWLGKLAWFAANPLREALALYVLSDDLGRTEPWYTIAQLIAAAAIATAIVSRSGSGIRDTAWRAAGWLVILLAGYTVSFVAVERWATYRTIWPLAGVVLVTTWLGVRKWVAVASELRAPDLHTSEPRQGRALSLSLRTATAVALAVVAVSAGWNVRQLIAKPQAQEWARMRDLAAEFDPSTGGGVFVVLPDPSDSTAALRHLDEFGSLSADSDWAAAEMFKWALRREHPSVPDPAARLMFETGYEPPESAEVGRIVDFRYSARVWTELRPPVDDARDDAGQIDAPPISR
jgi:hypothetical protein